MQSVLISELRRLAFCVAFLATICIAAHAQIPGGKLKIGVLSDFSGPFADQVGHGSDIAAQMSGHPEAATSLDKFAMKNKLASFRQQMTQAGTGNPMPGRAAAPRSGTA